MMEKPVRLIVMTPQETLLDVAAQAVELPGVCGLFEVLAGHAPLITALKEGAVEYKDGNGVWRKVGIASGFVEVLDNKVTVCAETK